MNQTNTKEAILRHLDALSSESLQRVLEFVKVLAAQPGVPGRDLVAFAGALDTQDAQRIEDSIEEGCE